jgi:lysophospholipase L1-like esterase
MFQRYVAIGDSSTEGLDDPDDLGGYRGWADRLAEQVAVTSPGLHYANLAVRGRLAGEVRAEQLPRALALRPDLATFFAGVNDLLRPRYDQVRVLAEVEHVLRELVAVGATVLTITCADPVRTMPIARPLRARVLAYNDGVRLAAARAGALVADVAAEEVASDPRLWSLDRLHANTEGHTRIAAALAEQLGLPGADHRWAEPLPVLPPRRRAELARAEADWVRGHFGPWVLRRVRRTSLGDGVVAKRPVLTPVA